MFTIIQGDHVVSTKPDADGNYRATSPSNPRFVGYGRNPNEAKENLDRNIREGKTASPTAVVEARFLALPADEQEKFLARMTSA